MICNNLFRDLMKTKSYNRSERDEKNFIVTRRSFSSLFAGISYNKLKKT